MKKFLIILAVVLLLVLATSTSVLAEQTGDDYKNTKTYQLLQEFLTACPDRSNSETEQSAATYLIAKFADMGYVANAQRVSFQSYGYETVNVVVNKDNATATDCIVIGAHYDSYGVGANDNASGVVALLQIAKQLKDVELPFDVYFVAFGGEEQGLLGSQCFVDSFSQTYKLPLSSIRLMINMDSIANGDNLYIHCENKSTTLSNFILQNKTGNAELLEKPYPVGVFNTDMWGYGYYEDIQGSDHTPFRIEGIPVASFFSGNFQNWNYVESTNSQNSTMNTNFDNLDRCNQSWIDKIDTVVNTVVATVVHNDFAQVSQNARDELLNLDLWYNRLWPKLVTLAIVVVLAVLAVLHNRKLQKQALMGTASANTTHIFETPSADDIFTFKD